MRFAGALCVSLDDLEEANKGFEPASCWGVGKVQFGEGPGPRGWQDVGGLGEVREALQEAMELPTRYAALIARCGQVPSPSDMPLQLHAYCLGRRHVPLRMKRPHVSTQRSPSGLIHVAICMDGTALECAGRRCVCGQACCCTGLPAAARRMWWPQRWPRPGCALSA